ncbi:SDR family oxidoreductase [Nocardia miyunensis]|uniref:SDR family oxidoreductase n=1 Tax=Nocardia miyunensis TaxID=282684 RepID=UPI001C3FE1CB
MIHRQFDQAFTRNTKGTLLTLRAAARHVANGGRIICIGTSTFIAPVPNQALYGSSKLAPSYRVQVLALELTGRGGTVNAILPTAIDGRVCSPTRIRTRSCSSSRSPASADASATESAPLFLRHNTF